MFTILAEHVLVLPQVLAGLNLSCFIYSLVVVKLFTLPCTRRSFALQVI